jgi:prepilin-type N-terminal cleavage/methylation domain-containing protein
MRTSRCAASSRSTSGLTLVEVVVATAIFSVAMTTVLGVLLSTETHVRTATTRQRLVERSRRLADVLVRELRDANFTAADLEPNAPLDDTSLEFRKVVGYDPTTGVALSPPRASNTFRRIWLAPGGKITVDVPGFSYVVAEGVADLRFTLVPPNLLNVTVRVESSDGQGGTSSDTIEVSVALKNQLP